MTVAIVVPARFASTRYPGKPLVPLHGPDGAKPLLRRTWEAASQVSGVSVVIATDDERIAEAACGFGGQVVMTPASCANGTERCAAALAALGDEVETVVNWQGDACLTPPAVVDALLAALAADPAIAVATPAMRASPATYHRLIEDQRAGRVGGTTLVTNAAGDALYFSKAVIPHVPPGRAGEADLPIYLHLGIYAYRRATLERYAQMPVGSLELLEGLEQLRFLHAGIRVRVVPVDLAHEDIWELNNPEDVAPIEAVLAARGAA